MVAKKCCICGRLLHNNGNNARPYKDGICCDNCNMKIVVPARINYLMKGKKIK